MAKTMWQYMAKIVAIQTAPECRIRRHGTTEAWMLMHGPFSANPFLQGTIEGR